MYIQQGDVIISPSVIPSDAKKSDTNVLQEGEATGHAHRLFDGDYQVYEEPKTKQKHLRLLTPTALRHEEHKEIILPPGDYHIGIVREYDHFSEEARRVAD